MLVMEILFYCGMDWWLAVSAALHRREERDACDNEEMTAFSSLHEGVVSLSKTNTKIQRQIYNTHTIDAYQPPNHPPPFVRLICWGKTILLLLKYVDFGEKIIEGTMPARKWPSVSAEWGRGRSHQHTVSATVFRSARTSWNTSVR